ncbi:hypothetical protein DRO35_04585 [Candidatus Bathyarchaeota archaeon]|nr:MAG: hypothetical protein DRO35_04585 [Candidatus Bathyarchaeota archaeon]
MVTVLPSGREVEIEKSIDFMTVSWFEKDIPHQIVLSATLTEEEIDKELDKYLYGYDDPESGEHVPGYFDTYGG